MVKTITSYDELLEFDRGLANNISISGMPDNIQFEVVLSKFQWKNVTKHILQFIPSKMITDTITQLVWISPVTNIKYRLVQVADKYKER